MSLFEAAKLRTERQRLRARAFRKRRGLELQVDRSDQIKPGDTLSFSVLRNELKRLPYFLKYYREMGIDHFFFVDNGSDDGTGEFIADQPDATVYSTNDSYKRSRFGVDWVNWLQMKYAHGHWSLVVDPDEFLVYPFCDTRPIQALTDWLDSSSVKSFGTMLIDMYAKGPINEARYSKGQDPFEIAQWFDSGNYVIEKNPKYQNLWIQGGPRARVFFENEPRRAPALNKIPLVKWHRRYAFVSSTHMLLPRGLNLVYETAGGEKMSGCLLHAKLLDDLNKKSDEELQRGQHYAHSAEYRAYASSLTDNPDFWCKYSEKYTDWRQLEILGLMSKGNWA
ncbi:MAG: glycosyltransferase family 2 protein [Litoreibacter sp.]